MPAKTGTTLGLFLAVILSFLCFKIWQWQAQPLECLYLSSYAKATLTGVLPGRQKPRQYIVLVDNGLLATEEEVEHDLPHVKWQAVEVSPMRMQSALHAAVYHRPLVRVLRPVLIAGGALLLLALIVGAWWDGKELQSLREGKQIRGRKLCLPKQFNRWRKKDDFCLHVEEYAITPDQK